MATFKSSDRIFATIVQRGRVILNLNISGITSITDIITTLSGQLKGLVTINLRNYTQGWQSNYCVMLAQ